MKLKRGIDTFPSKLGENRLIQRTAVSVLALICGGFAMALGTPPTEHEVISAPIQLEISEVSKALSDHLSLYKLPSEIFEEITGVAHENGCIVLGDSSTSLVQPILIMSIVDSCPQLSTIGSAVQLQTEPTSKYSGTATASNETETFELTSSAEINTYQVTTEIWSGTVVGYAITFDLHGSLSGDSSIVVFYPTSNQVNKFDFNSSWVGPARPPYKLWDCKRELNYQCHKAIMIRQLCDSHCTDVLPILGEIVVGAALGIGITACTDIPIVIVGGAVAGAAIGAINSGVNCEANCSYEEGVSLLIARLEYDKCKEIQLDPKDTGVQKTGTSPE